ncbi:DUF7310 family coiled-coil domain-containing protein [Haloarchaeobius salinus]|uniref:DUF7310 family coiled-coil domain-containing protein n=1 Tax=Haloarchaeobius salinus TaxID=1198298 RepID=UPI00210E922B|nr:hypothetical protein [Haloarchaeobius salinus]
MPDTLEDRLRAVERALDGSTDRAASVTTTPDEPNADHRSARRHDEREGDRLDEFESRLDDAETTLSEVEAAVQALRGYAGKVRSVDERVEERADAALAAVETLEVRVDELETAPTQSREHREPSHDGHCPHCDDQQDDDRPTTGRRDRTLDAEWPTSPAPRFESEDDTDADPGLLARLRDLL